MQAELQRRLEQAERELSRDVLYWETFRAAMPPATEQAEFSGLLAGRVQGLREALEIISTVAS